MQKHTPPLESICSALRTCSPEDTFPAVRTHAFPTGSLESALKSTTAVYMKTVADVSSPAALKRYGVTCSTMHRCLQ